METTEQAVTMKIAGINKGKAGGTAALDFEELYRGQFRPVYAFVAYRLRDRAAAEDVTSQVFEKAWRARRSFDPGRASASGWLFTIARNCVVDYLRRRGRAQESPLGENDGSDDGKDPEGDLLDRERSEMILSAMESLEDRERDIIAMKFGGGMSNGDIAAAMSLTPTNVSTILYRSLDKLKTQLEGGI